MPRIIFILVISGGVIGLIYWQWGQRLAQPQTPTTATTPVDTRTPPPKLTVSGLVVSPDDSVGDERKKLFAELVPQIAQPASVILVAANLSDTGDGQIQSTDRTWDTPLGAITPDTAVITGLASAGVTQSDGSFTEELGLKNIVGEIKQFFPSAKVVPLLVKSATTLDDVTRLETTLNQTCLRCLLIAAVDCSRDQPAVVADLHDDLTLRALDGLDAQAIMTKAEVDSAASLALLIKWATDHNTTAFQLQDHTNSGEVAKDADVKTTSRIGGWYASGDPTVPETSVTFLLGGDMMFGRDIAHMFLAGGLWKSLDLLGGRLFKGLDAGIINLEGPVSEVAVPDNRNPANLIFNFPPDTIQAMQYLHVNAVSLANNHTNNHGAKGLNTTKRLITAAGMQWFGGPEAANTADVARFEGQGLRLTMIGVHTLASTPDITSLIRQTKQDPNDRVIIFPHWGAEYVYKHAPSQEKSAQAWIDAGADAVIGSHPHVIEDSQIYNNKPIIYSLGNLLFDQSFSQETQQGLLVGGKFTDRGLYLFALPVQSNKYKPALMTGDAKKRLIDRLYAPFSEFRQAPTAGDVLFFPKLGGEH